MTPKMILIADAERVSRRMAEILNAVGLHDWAKKLSEISTLFDRDPNDASARALALYGGAGSLNDIVLGTRAELRQHENDEFASLRTKLFSLCHEIRLARS